MVGPQNLNPSFLRSFEISVDKGVAVGTLANVLKLFCNGLPSI